MSHKSPRTKGANSLKTSDTSMQFLELLKKQIELNLAHSEPGKNLTKKKSFEFNQFEDEHAFESSVQQYGITVKRLYHNCSPGELYEEACRNELGTFISDTGALMVSSGQKTGRSPQDKRIVDEPSCSDDVWWGKVNIKVKEDSYMVNRERAVDFLNTQERLFVIDAFAGWDESCRVKVRVLASRAYHALFMQNMLIVPSKDELIDFEPDFIVYNAGCFPANRYAAGITSQVYITHTHTHTHTHTQICSWNYITGILLCVCYITHTQTHTHTHTHTHEYQTI
eukprot:GHVR01141239.1.p1 GENE.GHVR01141239.1~~GHVR01141239.1.p1  ORF type:complete len:282 (+),score=109.92 GHVR01141239.1:51-896(+)